MTSNADIARSMADTMTHSAVPLYGKRLRLPDRGAIIGIIKELRRLFFPAYFGDPQLMTLPAENYVALLLERIETALSAQIALALPEDQSLAAAALTHEILEQLPRIQQTLMTDIEATFDGDPAAADKEEIIFAYPGLFAIFVYRIAHELYLRQIPMIPRMMTEYAHSRTGIDINPGAQIGPWFFIDHRHRHRRDHRDRQPRQAVPGRDAGRTVPQGRPCQPAGQAPSHRVRLCDHLLRRVHPGRRDGHR